MANKKLMDILRREATRAPSPALSVLAEAARARHGTSVEAVLFYGSCLREGIDDSKIADLYLLVSNYRRAYKSRIAGFFNRLLAPNVYYLSCAHEGITLRAKYAVITTDAFCAGTTTAWFHPYLWARFAQPTAFAYCAGEALRERVIAALANAVDTLLAEASPLLDEEFRGEDLWIGAFQETYRSELRAERSGRAKELFEADEARYLEIAATVFEATETAEASLGSLPRWLRQAPPGRRQRLRAQLRWLLRRPWGKLLSVLRLIKAAFTFTGGASYLKWKIERHSGVEVELTPWQARHPILASPLLLWQLYRKGAIR